jgi:hypothetical protein
MEASSIVFAFAALVLFVFAALPGLVVTSRVNLGWLGMAFLTLSWLIPHVVK